MASGRIICGTSSARLTTSSVRLTARLTTSSVRLTLVSLTLEAVSLAPGDIFFFGARLTFCEQLATWLVPRQGSQGSNVRLIFVFSLTLDVVSLTFEPYLKMQKKTDFQSDTRTFFKN